MRATLRIILLVPIGYISACLAAGGFVVLVAYGAGTDTVGGLAEAAPGEVLVVVVTAAAVLGAFGFLPGVVAIALAEAFGWRSVMFYLLAGGAVGLAAVVLLVPPERAFDDADARVFLAAGAVAGVVYWLIAGRSAGSRTARQE